MISIEEGGFRWRGRGEKTHSPLANAKFVSISRFASRFFSTWVVGYSPRALPRAANGKIPSRVIAADDRRAKGSSGELTRNRARYNDVLLACWLEFPETSRIS